MASVTLRGTQPQYQDADWQTFDGLAWEDDATVGGVTSYDKRRADVVLIAFGLRDPVTEESRLPIDFPHTDFYNQITAITYEMRFAHTGYGDDTFTMTFSRMGAWTGDGSDVAPLWGEPSDASSGDLGSGGGGPTTSVWAPAVQGPASDVSEAVFNQWWSDLLAGPGTYFGMQFTGEHAANMASDGPVNVSFYSVAVTIEYVPVAVAPPTVTLTADPSTVLTGDQVVLTADVTGLPAPTLVWALDGATDLGGDPVKTVQWDAAGTFNPQVTATNSSGSDVDSVPVTVDLRLALVWNGTVWEGAKSWDGTAWVTPKVWNGSRWVPFADHGGGQPPTPGGSPSFVSVESDLLDSSTGFTVARPAAAQDGDLLLCQVVSHASSGTITPDPGWATVQAATPNNDYTFAVFSRVVQAGDTSWEFSNSTANVIWSVATVRDGTTTTSGLDLLSGLTVTPEVTVGADALLLHFTGTDVSNVISWSGDGTKQLDEVVGADWLSHALFTSEVGAGTHQMSATHSYGSSQDIHGLLVAVT
jgi:hypothetical protein